MKRRGGITKQLELGRFISKRLIATNRLQNELGEALGIGKSSVTAIMNGGRSLSVDQFVAVCDFLQIRSSELFKAMGLKPPLKDRG